MATSTIPMSGLGTRSVITLPYTAPSDGFIMVNVSSNTSGGYAYLYVAVDGSSNTGCKFSFPAVGGSVTGMAPVRKGEIISELAKDKISDYAIRFIPLG